MMVKSYCVKEKKQTECVEPSGYKTAKNGRLMFWCTYAECGIKKVLVRKEGKLDQPVLGVGVMDTVAITALDALVHHALPYMA